MAMVSTTQVVNGVGSVPPSGIQEIVLDYDSNKIVTATPEKVDKGSTIYFTSPRGKVRVVFVSPFDDNTIEVLDSQIRTATVGGVYHFRCFFTEPGEGESEGRTGGILDVQPNRP
jgi:hypothetical protein